MNSLQKMEPQDAALGPAVPPEGLSIEQVFRAVVDKNISPENIQVMKQLLAMDAERKFNAAFVKLQSELPTIVATSIIPNRGKYERFEDVMHQISKHLQNNGFSVSFGQDFKDIRIIVTCVLMHSGGHSRSNSYAVRVSGKADSETQADCKASTTAKRNALLQALNIVVRQDCLTNEDDAGLDGDLSDFVTPAQAAELEHRLKMVDGNVKAFLEYAKADSFAKIPANKYAELDQQLSRKERGGR